MLSHQLKQFEIDGEKSIIQNPNEIQRKEHEKSSFELHEVYAIDVLVSTGEGVVSSIDKFGVSLSVESLHLSFKL
jgi:methionine aminopeptidase